MSRLKKISEEDDQYLIDMIEKSRKNKQIIDKSEFLNKLNQRIKDTNKNL